MIKGWRNDPQWVEFYKRRDQERVLRRLAILSAESQLQMSRLVNEDFIERIRKFVPVEST